MPTKTPEQARAMQMDLDSWWCPKCHTINWNNTQHVEHLEKCDPSLLRKK